MNECVNENNLSSIHLHFQDCGHLLFSETKKGLCKSILASLEEQPILVGSCNDIGNATEYLILGKSFLLELAKIR